MKKTTPVLLLVPLLVILGSVLVVAVHSEQASAEHGGSTESECMEKYEEVEDDFERQQKRKVCREHARAEASNEKCGKDEVEVSVGIDGVNCIPRGDTAESNAIIQYLAWIIRFLAGGVGLVITLMIVVSGFEYIMARGSSEKIAHAKKRLTEAIEALILFILMSAILNFLIPGGIL